MLIPPRKVINMPDPKTPANRGGARGPSSPRFRIAVGLVVLLLVGVGLTIWLLRNRPAAAPLDEDDELDRGLAVANPGYVGIETCAECHDKRAALVKTTRHYLACRTASGVAAPGFTPGRGRCDTRFPGLHFEMSRSGDDFLVTAVQATPRGEERVPYQVGLVYGSANKRDEMYFAWQGDRLVRLP